jgi:hypothetical protein
VERVCIFITVIIFVQIVESQKGRNVMLGVLKILGILIILAGIFFSFSCISLILPVLGLSFYSSLVFYLRGCEDV